MKTLSILLAAICLMAFAGCGSFHFHSSNVWENSNQPTSGGLYRVLTNGTVQALDNNDVINLPSSGGGLTLRYDSPRRYDTRVASVSWLVDGKPISYDGSMYIFNFGNPANGTYEISCITSWAWTGDNQFAGADTIKVIVRTYRDSWFNNLLDSWFNPLLNLWGDSWLNS
ncbi:MAG: hypothetical protein WCT08_02400 [Patescibacteria group bacterium]|jgi:hypothetical protein